MYELASLADDSHYWPAWLSSSKTNPIAILTNCSLECLILFGLWNARGHDDLSVQTSLKATRRMYFCRGLPTNTSPVSS
jgi:hypothetical protein